MEQKITNIITYIAASHREMSKILQTKGSIAGQMSSIITEIPDLHPEFDGVEGIQEHSSQIIKSVVAYLNSLAELEEAIAQQTEIVMKEMNGPDAEE
ncbi:nucleoside-diphosphate sugar epimerase [Paenibacillus sp. GP183]|uniref:nucleoside-diphosphate sugar epimerase n=1 Tax=Paenibacillus sp. GP183 TaxID=1882751 RepID=UPI000894B74D|nr:nucleoside-diphosphate sugar epimerase [Paenibacillus sp. GP183]SEC70665.1 hypothetical protein SAMN05443246_5074 [Paenibacillus sp. GP183]